MINFFRTLLGTNSVAAITTKLQSTVSDLEQHASAQRVEAAAKLAKADELKAAAAVHTDEHELASKVAANIKALLTV